MFGDKFDKLIMFWFVRLLWIVVAAAPLNFTIIRLGT